MRLSRRSVLHHGRLGLHNDWAQPAFLSSYLDLWAFKPTLNQRLPLRPNQVSATEYATEARSAYCPAKAGWANNAQAAVESRTPYAMGRHILVMQAHTLSPPACHEKYCT